MTKNWRKTNFFILKIAIDLKATLKDVLATGKALKPSKENLCCGTVTIYYGSGSGSDF
jgi:hypothetical protein